MLTVCIYYPWCNIVAFIYRKSRQIMLIDMITQGDECTYSIDSRVELKLFYSTI